VTENYFFTLIQLLRVYNIKIKQRRNVTIEISFHKLVRAATCLDYVKIYLNTLCSKGREIVKLTDYKHISQSPNNI
jgi:hypothetical protein